MIYSITHRTRYEYSEPAALSQNDVCLSSRTTSHQTCESVDLNIFPVPSSLSERSDYFDNRIHQFMVQHPHNRLEIVTQSKVLTHPLLPPDASATPVLPEVLRLMDIHKDPATLEATEFMFPSAFIRPSTDFLNYAQTSFPPGRAVLEGAIELTSRIFNDFKYDKAATSVGTPIEKVFQDRKGVCQDFAHLQIACLRSLNLAARYVSGYLETLPPPGKENWSAPMHHMPGFLFSYPVWAGWTWIPPTT